mgnify:CR=1 FL=1
MHGRITGRLADGHRAIGLVLFTKLKISVCERYLYPSLLILIMNEYNQKLIDYIKVNNVQAEHLVFQTSCHSVQEAAVTANAKVEDFVKNVCVINEESGKLIVCIIGGNKKLDLRKLADILRTRKLRLARSDEVLEKTGYPAGGTPSFGYWTTFFIDKEVLEKEIVYSGGGSTNALTKISPKEIIRVNHAKIEDISKV